MYLFIRGIKQILSYQGIFFYQPHTKFYLQSNLTPHSDEIIGDHAAMSTTDHVFIICQIIQK